MPGRIISFIDQSDINDLLHSQMQNCRAAGDDFLFEEHIIRHGRRIFNTYEHIVNGSAMCLTRLCDGNLALNAVSNPKKDRKCRFKKIHVYKRAKFNEHQWRNHKLAVQD